MSQVPVKWAYEGDIVDDKKTLRDYEGAGDPIPVVPLSALREVVEGLIGKTTKERVECANWDAGYVSATNDLLASLGEK